MKREEGEKKYLFARWMGWLFLAASILLLIYTYYRAERVFQGGRSAHYFKYYLVSLTGILFWGFILRLREEIQANIVTIVTSLVVGLYMIEGGLTFLGFGHLDHRAAIAAELGVEYDKRTKMEVIDDLIAEGVDAVPAVTASHLLTVSEKLSPLGGVSHKATVGNNELGHFIIYPSDRYGFNNPDAEWDVAKVDWILTGDSYTEGTTVHPDKNIAGHLRAITHQSVINLGRSGNGLLMELAALEEYAKVVKPKRALWIYYEGNDLREDFQLGKKHPLLMQYMEDGFSQNLINRQKEIDSRLEKYIVAERRLYKLNAALGPRWVRLFALRRMIGFDRKVDVDVVDPVFAKILIKAKAGLGAWGGELHFVYLPEYERYSNRVISHDSYNKKSEVIELVKGLNIPVIDIHQEVFAKHPDPLSLYPFHLPGHFTADGYAEVAKAIVENIKLTQRNTGKQSAQ